MTITPGIAVLMTSITIPGPESWSIVEGDSVVADNRLGIE
jgi:hypothetical protein